MKGLTTLALLAGLTALSLGCDSQQKVSPEPPSSAAPKAASTGKATASGAAARAGGAAAPKGSAKASGATPAGLTIVEGWSSAEGGFIKIHGEIKNDSDQWIIAPGVDVEHYDAGGKPLGVTSVVTETRKELGKAPRDGQPAVRHLLPPGEVAVFAYTRDVKKLSGTYASHKLFPTGRVYKDPPPKVVITKEKTRQEPPGTYFITGAITNQGKEPCRSPTVVVGFYSADGKVRLATQKTPDELFQKNLEPGRSLDFEVKKHTFKAAADIKSVKVWADCRPR